MLSIFCVRPHSTLYLPESEVEALFAAYGQGTLRLQTPSSGKASGVYGAVVGPRGQVVAGPGVVAHISFDAVEGTGK